MLKDELHAARRDQLLNGASATGKNQQIVDRGEATMFDSD